MKKLDLGGIQPASKAARPTHPQIEFAESEPAMLLEQWAQINPQFKLLKNQNETLAKQLAPHIKAAFFAKYHGVAPESSTLLIQVGGRTVKLITKNSYSKTLTDEAGLIQAIGAEAVAEHFRQATVIKLELDKVAEDKQDEFAAAVIKLAQDMGVTDAVSASQCIQPKAGFHDMRTTLLTPAENIALDAVLPITAYPQL